MNSMFSSFEAVCAELLGQRVRSNIASSYGSTNPTTTNNGNSSKNSNQSDHKKQPPNWANVERKQAKGPRLAPELDGLFCFETLV